MVSIGYPQEILEFEYDPTFAVRYLLILIRYFEEGFISGFLEVYGLTLFMEIY